MALKTDVSPSICTFSKELIKKRYIIAHECVKSSLKSYLLKFPNKH